MAVKKNAKKLRFFFLKGVDGIIIEPAKTKPVHLLSMVEELKQSVVMIKVY